MTEAQEEEGQEIKLISNSKEAAVEQVLSAEEINGMKSENLIKLRGLWQFAAICQFFSLYGDQFGLTDFDSYVGVDH